MSPSQETTANASEASPQPPPTTAARIEKNRARTQAQLQEAQSKAPLNRPGLATRPFQRHLNRNHA